MARKGKTKTELKGKARLRLDIVKAMRGLHKIGLGLTTEHIIPLSVGGKWVLPKSSCKVCAAIT